MGLLLHIVVISFLFSALDLVYCQTSNGPIVNTKFGKVQGLYTDEARIFRSIPYAGPVDGASRWKNAKFPEPWDGIFNATREGIGCPQKCDLPTPSFTCPRIQVENCLLLNVFTPRNISSSLPVLVFFHGGAFMQGYGGSQLFDGRYIVDSGDIILVTINYRLGALANMVYGSGKNAIIANFAIKDQRLALEWVKMNIEEFGGNPNDVTIAGQSAGGISVAIHMTSIKSSGLFHKGIVESYPFGAPIKSITESRRLGEDFAEKLGCGKYDDYDCLYSKSFAEVAEATKALNSKIVNDFHLLEIFIQWSPVIDGIEVIGQPLDLFEEGKVNNVPLMIGTTSQEAVIFIYRAYKEKMSTLNYDELLLGAFSLHYEALHKLYHTSNDDKRAIASKLGTDEVFLCATRYAAKAYANRTSGVSPVYYYVFDHVWSFQEGWEPYSLYNACRNASCHAAELPFIFKTIGLYKDKDLSYTNDEMTLANGFMSFVSNFVKYGNPNFGKELVEWTHFSAETSWPIMILKTPQIEIINDYYSSYCDPLDKIGYNV